MNREELKKLWQQEEDYAFSGWDFSHVDDRCIDEPLPWDYRERVKAFLRPDVKLLDMGTGGGEALLSFGHPFELTAVTEGWPPNVELCRKKLAPLGITVKEYDGDSEAPMPFEDNSFDLVINRHESYKISEIRRILKPDGFFITQQVGGQNGRELARRLLSFDRAGKDFNLENEVPKFQKAGFRIMYRHQAYPVQKFLDVGAICFQAKILEWEYPNFSVEACFDKLLDCQREIDERGFLENQEHRFIIIAKKR